MSDIAVALAAIAQAECPVLIIGGNALGAHGYSRMTVDVDCMVAKASLEKLDAVLRSHGFLRAGGFSSFHEYWFEGKPGGMPIHAMFVDEATFENMWAGRVQMPAENGSLHAPRMAHLIALKLHAVKNSPKRMLKDMADVIELLERNPDAITKDELADVCTKYASQESVSVLKERGYL